MIIGTWRRGAGRYAALALLVTVAACGGSGGGQHTFDLPAGTELDTTASDRVLLVVESKNQCGDSRSCVATPQPVATPGAGGGCDLGNGNSRGLALYRLGTNGLFLEDPAHPGSAAPPDETGSTHSEYTALSLLSRDFVAASGRERIEIFRRVDGLFPPPTPLPSATPTIGPTPSCFGGQLVTVPVSFLGASIVTDTFFSPSSTTPIGELFVSEEVSRRLFTFNIDAAGTINGKETSSTKRDGFYQSLLRRDRIADSLLYASVFQEGRVAVFRLENGLLPEFAFSKTGKDPKTTPVGIAFDGPTGTILYVAESGVGRLDGFRVQADGGLPEVPDTSTVPVTTADGRRIDSFPSDIAIIPAP